MEDKEISPGGSEVMRHKEQERDIQFAAGNAETVNAVSAHIEKHIGPIELVHHELVSDIVHVDLHWVKATDKRPFHTYVTSGMSDLPMTVPKELDDFKYAELMIALPKEWPTDEESWKDENHWWPLRGLKYLARFPHKYKTWLGWGHTIPNGNPPEPFAARTEMNCWVVMPPVTVPDNFMELKTKDGRKVRFYAIVPLYDDETEFKLEKGMDALIDLMDKAHVNEVLDITRKSVVPKKKGFWPFSR